MCLKNISIVTKEVEMHVTPLETLIMEDKKLTIEFDDISEQRWRISFCPYQSFKVTTIDCIDIKPFLIDGKRPLFLLEVINSGWIKELNNILKVKDHNANFLDKVHHYVLPFQDNIMEIVAWDNYKLEALMD